MELIKKIQGSPIYKNPNNNAFYHTDGMTYDHVEIMSEPFKTVEECEQSLIDLLESHLF